jgi:flagellar hook-associated protein 3 FlgL
MKVTDFILQNTYLNNINRQKYDLNKVQEQITTQQKVNRPSDSPLGTARIIRFTEQLGNIQTYLSNAENAGGFVNKTISSMQSIQTIVSDIQGLLVQTDNALSSGSFDDYAQKIEAYLGSIIDYANEEYDGKYLFAGSTFYDKPFSLNETTLDTTFNSSSPNGSHSIRLSKSIEQRINIGGEDLFASVMKLNGNFDRSAAVGTTSTLSNTIYDADGNEYGVQVTYTKTAANQYSMQYNITDAASNVVANDTLDLAFDATTGELVTMDGTDPANISIDMNSPKIRFKIDPTNLYEADRPAALAQNLDLKGDFFNTLASISMKLANGEKPSENQVALINDFNNHILDKLSEEGNIANRIDSILNQLTNEETNIQELVSNEKDTDMVKAALDLQTLNYSLEYAYKISSMILPQSLLDYL